jgi:hypothetical protein
VIKSYHDLFAGYHFTVNFTSLAIGNCPSTIICSQIMKLLLRFVLLLCILLLAGNAHTTHLRIGYFPGNTFELSVPCNFSSVHNDRLLSSNAPLSGKNSRDKLKAAEVDDDDDDVRAAKKNIGFISIPFLYTQVSDYIHTFRKCSLPFCEHFSLISPYKFIIHRVIRI